MRTYLVAIKGRHVDLLLVCLKWSQEVVYSQLSRGGLSDHTSCILGGVDLFGGVVRDAEKNSQLRV